MLINCFIFCFCERKLKTYADYILISPKYCTHPIIKIEGLTLHSSLSRHVHLYSSVVSYHKVPKAPAVLCDVLTELHNFMLTRQWIKTQKYYSACTTRKCWASMARLSSSKWGSLVTRRHALEHVLHELQT